MHVCTWSETSTPICCPNYKLPKVKDGRALLAPVSGTFGQDQCQQEIPVLVAERDVTHSMSGQLYLEGQTGCGSAPQPHL